RMSEWRSLIPPELPPLPIVSPFVPSLGVDQFPPAEHQRVGFANHRRVLASIIDRRQDVADDAEMGTPLVVGKHHGPRGGRTIGGRRGRSRGPSAAGGRNGGDTLAPARYR